MWTRPRSRRSFGALLWAPIVVALAYLPDIVNQFAILVGITNVRVITHSVLFALVASAVLGLGLARLASVSRWRACSVCLVSVLVHDALDMLQVTDPRPWWPIPIHGGGFRLRLIPVNSTVELAWFGGAFVVFAVVLTLIRRHFGRGAPAVPSEGRPNAYAVWGLRALTLAILLAASVTHYLRSVRQREYVRVQWLVRRGQHEEALALADRAALWPSTAKPGRLAYAKAEAYLGLGDRQRAEDYYLWSYREDPSFFWVVADLAVFYAESDAPSVERRVRVAPYLQHLRRDFAHHRSLPGVLKRIERKLTERSG